MASVDCERARCCTMRALLRVLRACNMLRVLRVLLVRVLLRVFNMLRVLRTCALLHVLHVRNMLRVLHARNMCNKGVLGVLVGADPDLSGGVTTMGGPADPPVEPARILLAAEVPRWNRTGSARFRPLCPLLVDPPTVGS